jgi:uncharacterized membrane protein
MYRTRIAQKMADAGLVHTNSFRNSYEILPALALCLLTTAWSQTTLSLRAPHVLPNREGAAQQTGAAQQAGSAAVTSASARYRFITIDVPGSTVVNAFQINNLNVVTGDYLDGGSNWHGFVWWNGILRTVDKPGFVDTQLNATNNLGVAIGNYGDLNTQHAATHIFWRDLWTTLPDISGKPVNIASSINDFGLMVGAAGEGSVNAPIHNVPWVWDPTKNSYSFLSVPGASGDTGAEAFTINDKGQIVGDVQDANGDFHAFLKDHRGYTIFDAPGAKETGGSAINNLGTIVAGWEDDAGVEHGYIRTADGVFTTVDFPGAVQSAVFGINDQGNLCGFWLDAAGVSHGWVGFRF